MTVTKKSILLATLLTLSGCASDVQMARLSLSDVAARHSADARRPLTSVEKTAVIASVKSVLKDPASANFKWYPVVVTKGVAVQSYCALVNSKNSYGGYTGDAPFMVFINKENGKPSVSFGDMGSGDISGDETRAVLKACANAGYVLNYSGPMLFVGSEIPVQWSK